MLWPIVSKGCSYKGRGQRVCQKKKVSRIKNAPGIHSVIQKYSSSARWPFAPAFCPERPTYIGMQVQDAVVG